jgi:hypothetical protein
MSNFAATFVVSSESSEKLREALRLVTDRARPDNVDTDVARAGDRVSVRHHRVGDYFSSIHVADAGPTSFRIIFVPRENADRYWRDLAVRILLSVRNSGVHVRSEKRNDEG